MKGREITILGAGIGGLCLATALAQRGAQVRVLEQAPALTEVGAGIQISANGMVVLRRLGVVAGDPEGAVRSEGTELVDYRRGDLVMQVPPPAAGATWYFHRADLLDLLASAARTAGADIRLGRQAVGIAEDGDVAVIRLAGGGEARTRTLIAADGVRGPGRAYVAGPGAPRFSGQVAWRAVVPWAGPVRNVATVAMGPGRHVVTYPLRDGRAMNLVAVEERRDWTEENWRQAGNPDELRARFSDFGGNAGEVLAKAGKVHLWALHLHDVAARWHLGPVALLGDAAHPTLPFMAQGACLAIEDAWALTECLDHGGEDPFARYEAMRKDRASKVVAAAAANAWRFHLRAPFRQPAQLALRLAGRWIAPDFDWIYGYDVTAGR